MAPASTEATEEAMLGVLRSFLESPGARRLYGNGRSPGLFPSNTASSRRLAEQLCAREYLEVGQADNGIQEARITERGRQWVLQKENTRLLLEDLLRAAEAQVDRLQSMQSVWAQYHEQLEQHRSDVARVLERLPQQSEHLSIEPFVVDHLSGYQQSGQPGDCSLAELYHRLIDRHAGITIGQFHDCLRAMHRAGRLRLAPWTGPLYQLPEPALALLIGHEVLYYVHLARTLAA